ncbi:hypothetical protein HOD75_03745 [archaeon]|jgi:glutamyl-tRNA synthetase|nr:hypothetical protein [archaeon]MBT4241984.1 hypothetical protein [archaeon]MBT4418531.1 hypothetical protein [archaeon]
MMFVLDYMISKKIIRAYVLKNALEHKGNVNPGSVVSGLFNHGLKKDKIKDVMKDIVESINEIKGLKMEGMEDEFEGLKDLIGHRVEREGIPELENVGKNGVIMRFSPSPSGALHIGHALTASLSYLYIKKYGGKFYIRIEDTNPDNIYVPAYKMIERESKWLFENNVEMVIQSERMELYYRYVDKLLKKGACYVCECDSDDFRELIKNKQACECRGLDMKEHKRRWRAMLNGGYEQGEAVLRFKTPEEFGGIKHKNVAMRDFPLARINEGRHPLRGKEFRVWPLMNLAVSVDDIEMKMTHIIRAKDHRDNAERQRMIFEVLGKKFPWVGFLGRIHLKDIELSSSKIREGVIAGKYSNWSDKKLFTIASLKKQGYKPEAFWKLAEQIGLKEVDKKIDKKEFLLLLDGFNR